MRLNVWGKNLGIFNSELGFGAGRPILRHTHMGCLKIAILMGEVDDNCGKLW